MRHAKFSTFILLWMCDSICSVWGLHATTISDMVIDQQDFIKLNMPSNCNVNMRKKDFNHYLIENPECCLNGGRNVCCDVTLSSMRIDDPSGIPICGRFIFTQTTMHGAGLGHWLVDYNRNIVTSILYNMDIVKFSYMVGPRGSDKSPGHDASIILGLEKGLHYNFSQLEQAVVKGYIKRYDLKDEERNKFQQFIQQDTSKNVWYVSPKPLAQESFSISRCYIRKHISSSSIMYPQWHKIPFRAGITNVVIHIRRGDVLSNRFINNAYFIEVGKNLLGALNGSCDIHILSEGSMTAFQDINSSLPNVHFHLNGKSWITFLMMYYADVLVTSVSAYSHIAAEIGNAVVIAGRLWNPLSDRSRVIRTINGTFDRGEFITKLAAYKQSRPCYP